MRRSGFTSILLCLLLAFAVSPLVAGDFGVTIDSGASLDFVNNTWSVPVANAKATLWANALFGGNYGIDFSGSYTWNTSRLVYLELDQLKFDANWILGGAQPSTLGFQLGRLTASDFSGKVFAHTGDGISVRWGLPWLTFSAQAVYTGLIQQPGNGILMSLSDIVDRVVDPIPYFGPLGAPRLVEMFSISAAEFWERQTLMFSGVFQQDLRPAANLTPGGSLIHTNYLGLGLSGPIGSGSTFAYSVYAWGNQGQIGAVQILAGLAGGSISLTLPLLAASRFALEAQIASGDADYASFYEGNTLGTSSMFTPITMAPAGMIFTAQQSNLAHVAFTYSVRPFLFTGQSWLANLMLMLKPTAFFRSTTGAISAPGVSATGVGYYLGTEIDMMLLARAFSDLGFSLGGGVFIPSVAMESQVPSVKVTASVSLTL